MLTRTPLAAPSSTATLTVGAALALSTIPSLLPRLALTQGVLTGVLVLVALATLALGRRLARHRERDNRRTPPRALVHARWLVLVGTGLAVVGTGWLAQVQVTTTAAELTMPGPGPTHWLVAGLWALPVIGLGLGLQRLGRRLVRLTRRRTALPLAAVLLAGVTVTSGAAAPADLLAPLRKELGPEHVMLTESPLGATRSFALVGESPTPEDGAELAVRRLVAAGGLDQSAILVVLPTGSGWVNREAINGIEARLDGDVAVVSAQHGDLPSWWSYLIAQEPSRRSAEALLNGVVEQIDALPVGERPNLYVYGESLGALAGQSAVAATDPAAICGALWSGAPGGALSGHPRERSLHNADDPIAYLTLETALERPADWPTVWLPGLSYATTVLDLGASLAPEHGHGHRYGAEQDWSLPQC